jgi:hypothetical protein
MRQMINTSSRLGIGQAASAVCGDQLGTTGTTGQRTDHK